MLHTKLPVLHIQTLPLETELRIQIKIFSFLLAEGLCISGKMEWETFHFWWNVPYMFSADLPAGKLSEVSEICFDYTALFEGISYRRFNSKTKENTSLSSAVVLRFFLLLCLLCRGLVKFFFLVTHKKFCGCFVNLWWQYYDFFFLQ